MNQNWMFAIIRKPIKFSLSWYPYLKLWNLGDIPHFDEAGHISEVM